MGPPVSSFQSMISMTSIDHANLSRLDLNLLVAFDALLTERSVTRAAARVGLGQSAMSHNLARLRTLFGDELLTRGAEGMRPTPRALALADPVRVTLAQIQAAVLQRKAFDPATAERIFRIGLADSIEVAVIPSLLARLRKEAPSVSLRLRSINRYSVLEELDTGKLDLGVGVFDQGQIQSQAPAPLYRQLPLLVQSRTGELHRADLACRLFERAARSDHAQRRRPRRGRRGFGQAQAKTHHRADDAGFSRRALRRAGRASRHHHAIKARALFRRRFRFGHEPATDRTPQPHHLAPLARKFRSRSRSCLAQANDLEPGLRGRSSRRPYLPMWTTSNWRPICGCIGSMMPSAIRTEFLARRIDQPG
jgi:DNA-binding transcriptional LysR family regulator